MAIKICWRKWTLYLTASTWWRRVTTNTQSMNLHLCILVTTREQTIKLQGVFTLSVKGLRRCANAKNLINTVSLASACRYRSIWKAKCVTRRHHTPAQRRASRWRYKLTCKIPPLIPSPSWNWTIFPFFLNLCLFVNVRSAWRLY